MLDEKDVFWLILVTSLLKDKLQINDYVRLAKWHCDSMEIIITTMEQPLLDHSMPELLFIQVQRRSARVTHQKKESSHSSPAMCIRFFFFVLRVAKENQFWVEGMHWTLNMKYCMPLWIMMVCISLFVCDMYNYVSQIWFDCCIQVLFYQ